jgi:hypothetical protein
MLRAPPLYPGASCRPPPANQVVVSIRGVGIVTQAGGVCLLPTVGLAALNAATCVSKVCPMLTRI